jgi:2-polyprenyl-3-methyl-5-hydroxy-6-metoxy-1,4-benzoquinol methylase
MIIGSILRHFSRLELSTADDKHYTLVTTPFNRLALFLIGIPHLGFRMRARVILAEALKEAKPQSKILDAGCGFGMYSMILAEKGFTMDSIDVDKIRTDELLRMTEEFPVISDRIHVFTGSLTQLPFTDNTYDLLICSEVIEHIPDHLKAIHELSRTLKPGGKLILTVPYSSAFNMQHYKRFAHERPGYKKNELRQLFAAESLELETAKYYEHWLGTRLFNVFNKLHSPALMGILFYPFYALYLLDHVIGSGEPNQIVVTARKN